MDSIFNFEEYYDKYGADYVKKRLQHGGLLFNEMIELPVIISLLQSVKMDSRLEALDIGASFGGYSKILAELGFIVTGIDISSSMIKIAREYCSEQQFVTFLHGDFLNFDFKQKKYDLILGCFMLGYFNDLSLFFKKLQSISNNDCLIILSMLHPLVQNKVERHNDGYIIKGYFETGFFRSNFLNNDTEIQLKRWSFSDIIDYCSENGFYLHKLIEPKPIKTEHITAEQFQYYSKLPSISIFLVRKLPKR